MRKLKGLDKIHANITLSRYGRNTLFRIGIPAELLEGTKKDLVKEIVFRSYAYANDHVNTFIKETDLPILVIDEVKNLTRKVRITTAPEYTPVDEVDSLRLKFRPDKLVTVEKSKDEVKSEAVYRLMKLRDKGQISDFQFVKKLIEVTK